MNGGPGSRVYWFYFFKLPRRAYGSDIPRFTKAEEAKLIEEVQDYNILPNLKFRELVKNKISSTMTALPEYVYEKWFFNRLITIGDSSHKVGNNPYGRRHNNPGTMAYSP